MHDGHAIHRLRLDHHQTNRSYRFIDGMILHCVVLCDIHHSLIIGHIIEATHFLFYLFCCQRGNTLCRNVVKKMYSTKSTKYQS